MRKAWRGSSLALALALAACGGTVITGADEESVPPSWDAAPGNDAAPGEDASPGTPEASDAVIGPEVVVDAPSEVLPDAPAEAQPEAPPDAPVEVGPDAPAEAGPVCTVLPGIVNLFDDTNPAVGVQIRPSRKLQPGEWLWFQVNPSAGAIITKLSVLSKPDGATPQIAHPLPPMDWAFSADVPGEYKVALDFLDTNGCLLKRFQTTALVRPLSDACDVFEGTIVAVTSCCPNRLVQIDPCTGEHTEVAVVGDQTFGFPQGVYTLDRNRHLMLLVRSSDGEPGVQRLVGFSIDNGAQEVDIPLQSPVIELLHAEGAAGPIGFNTEEILQFDLQAGTYATKAPMSLCANGCATGVGAIDETASRLFIQQGETIRAVDASSGALLQTLQIGAQDLLASPGFDSASGIVGWSIGPNNAFMYYELATGTPHWRAWLGPEVAGFPMGIYAAEPNKHRYVDVISSGYGSSMRLIVLDTRTGSQVLSLPWDGPGPLAIEYDPWFEPK